MKVYYRGVWRPTLTAQAGEPQAARRRRMANLGLFFRCAGTTGHECYGAGTGWYGIA